MLSLTELTNSHWTTTKWRKRASRIYRYTQNGSPMDPISTMSMCICVSWLMFVCTPNRKCSLFSYTHTESYAFTQSLPLHVCVWCGIWLWMRLRQARVHTLFMSFESTCDRTKKTKWSAFFCACSTCTLMVLSVYCLFAVAPNTLHFGGVMITTNTTAAAADGAVAFTVRQSRLIVSCHSRDTIFMKTNRLIDAPRAWTDTRLTHNLCVFQNIFCAHS